MVAGILINDPNANLIFDGTQRIPKILAQVDMKAGDVSRSVQLPRALRGTLYYYFQSNSVAGEPYYEPMLFNFRVTVSGLTATVTFQPYASYTAVGKPFVVYIGEY